MNGGFGLGPLLLSITLSVVWFLSLRPAVDPDYGWHIQNGRHVFDGSLFLGRDLYSWTASGHWVVPEWMTQAVMAVLNDSLGPWANSVLVALLGTLVFFLSPTGRPATRADGRKTPPDRTRAGGAA